MAFHDDAYTSLSDHCTRCNGTGFINLNQVPDDTLWLFEQSNDPEVILRWIEAAAVHAVAECECGTVGPGPLPLVVEFDSQAVE